ncbi:MAG: DUF2177 family protein [Oligoflexia bacterium]|nr:DUF2177 family protein [Oligoflexia bacterium]
MALKPTTWIATFIAFITLDALWFKLVVGDFFHQRLLPLIDSENGSIKLKYFEAGFVYFFLTLGLLTLVATPKKATLTEALIYGAIYGLVVYGVYDFTNRAVLKHWPWDFMLVDIAWGSVSCALVSGLAFYLEKQS